MKLKFNLIIFAILALLVFTACENEEIEITDANAQQLVVSNSTLANLMTRTTANEDAADVIECVDFVYPISFSVFDSEFNIIDTITIANDDALHVFLNNLGANDNALIVSLNFPVTLQYVNGESIEVNSNQELVDAIEATDENCETDMDCSLDAINAMLQECLWDFNDSVGTYSNYQMQFNQNGDVLILEGLATSAIGGNWDLSLNNDGLSELVFTNLTAFSEDLEGFWVVVDCDIDGALTIMRGDDTLQLNQDCETNTFECFENFDASIELCDENNDGVEVFNLTTAFANCITNATVLTYHINQEDAQNGINAIPNPEAYTNTTTPQEIYVRVAINNQFEVFTLNLFLETCSVFECFQSFDAAIELCDENNDGFEVFDLTTVFSNCMTNDTVLMYFETLQDAEINANPIANAQAYTNSTNPQTIYARVEIGSEFEIFPIDLSVQECTNTSGCSEEEVNTFLIECIWNATNYNNSDSLAEWHFDFEANSNIVVIYTATETIDATWVTSQTSSGISIEFSNVTGANIQAITGNWLVVECEQNRFELHRDNDILILERTCN